jgi:autotransporter passenger strand-loop-strand repeat protein
MAFTSVGSGLPLSGATIHRDDVVVVHGGGVVTSTTDDGFLTISSGGSAANTIVGFGGFLQIYAQGSATGVTVYSGGFDQVMGGTESGGVIEAEGFLTVASGGVAEGDTIQSGAHATISAGSLLGATIAAGASVAVYSGASLVSATLLRGAAVDLGGVAYASGGYATLDRATDVLTIIEGGTSTSLQLAGDYTGDSFHLSSDNAVLAAGSDVAGTVISIACYCLGTLILTAQGERPVETLAIGDTVMTAGGQRRPIRWIGRRSYAGHFIARNHLMQPVTIQAGAFADGVPHTDLTLSPGHAMWVDGQLVPAWRLVNGVNITQTETVEQITYLHVELHQHDLLLANGAPAESFLDETGFRGQFQNAAEFATLYPNAAAMAPMQARLEDGFALQRIQERRANRAGVPPVVEPVGALRGYVDQAAPERVCGWAQDLDSPEEPVALEISVGDVPVMTVLANAFRADLRKAGVGSGCHAFEATLPVEVTGEIVVRRVTDGSVLARTTASTDWDARHAA